MVHVAGCCTHKTIADGIGVRNMDGGVCGRAPFRKGRGEYSIWHLIDSAQCSAEADVHSARQGHHLSLRPTKSTANGGGECKGRGDNGYNGDTHKHRRLVSYGTFV